MTLGEWTGGRVEPSTGDEPPENVDWTPVTVPGRPEQFAGADAVAYRTSFSDPRSGEETRAVIELEGLFAHARVWLNGELLGEHDAYFQPARFPIEPQPENELVVECRAPEDRFAGVYGTDLVPESLAVPGIWWSAGIETYPDVFVDEFRVTPNLTPGGATIEAALTVDAGDDVDDRVTFSLRPEGFRGGGMMERAPVTASAGDRVTVRRTIELRDPSAWWPRGYGPQNRYAVRARFGGEGYTTKTGFCTVRRDEDGLYVNGRRIPLRGFNVLPGGDPAEDVERAAEANATLVRAHAHVPPRAFHEACDEHGLLVWQDLPLSGPGGYDISRATDLAETLVAEYDRHPSVGLYGVHDDPRRPIADDLGGGRIGKYRLRWRAWRTEYNHSPDERVAESFPDDRAVFPVVGPVGTAPDAATIYPGWDFGNASDVTWLLDRYPDLGTVVGEFGAGALSEGDPSALEDSQSEQAKALKTVAETLRRRGSDALALFALRDPSPAADRSSVSRGSRRHDAGLGVLASDGTPKDGFGAIADSYEPVQAVVQHPIGRGSTDVVVCNDSTEAIEGELAWTAGDESGSEPVSVDAGERAAAGSVGLPDGADALELSLSTGNRTITNRYVL